MEKQIQEIIRKVSKLFHRYGIKSVSMDDVARELSISKKTLYKLFKDKEDLVSKVLDCPAHNDFQNQPNESKLNVVQKHIAVYDTIVDFLTNLNPSFEYDLKKYYPKLYRNLINKRREIIIKKMKGDLEQGIAEGFYRKDIDIDIITLINIMRMESLQTSDLLEVFHFDLIDVVEEAFKFHFYGIATPYGIEEYERLKKQNDHE